MTIIQGCASPDGIGMSGDGSAAGLPSSSSRPPVAAVSGSKVCRLPYSPFWSVNDDDEDAAAVSRCFRLARR